MEVKKGTAGLQELKRQVVIATKTRRKGHQIRGCCNEQGPICEGVYYKSLVDDWTPHARLTETYSKREAPIGVKGDQRF